MAYMRTPERENARQQVMPPERREPPIGERHEEPARARQEDTTTAWLAGGGSALESLGGAAAATLGIIGLTDNAPLYTCAAATIAAGAALLVHGGVIAARFQQLMGELAGGRFHEVDVGTGATAELLGGLSGVVLGILAAVGIAPLVLLPAAAISLGASLLFSGAAEPAFAGLRMSAADMSPSLRRAASEALRASSAALVLAGLASLVLGVLALVSIMRPLTGSLIGMLVVGVALFFGGGALVARVAKAMT